MYYDLSMKFAVAVLAFAAPFGLAQTIPPAEVPSGKPLAFDVVSIKPSQPGEEWHFGFSPTGYSAAGVSLGVMILQAYFPFNMAGRENLVGAPEWVWKTNWDVEAKIAAEDMAAYKAAQHPFATNPIGQQLLQSMLADRFHLVIHRVPAEMEGYALTITKGGPRLKEAAPDEPQPSGSIPAPGGGYLTPYKRGDFPHMTFNSVTMSGFATQLRGTSGGAVVDRTGLTGRYDFTLSWHSSSPDERLGIVDSDDPDKLSHWNLGALGLRADHVKLPTEHIVIDSVDHPTSN